MTAAELIERLTALVKEQADIIKIQADDSCDITTCDVTTIHIAQGHPWAFLDWRKTWNQ